MLLQTTCRGYEILERFHVRRSSCSVPDDDPQYFIRPLLCLASNECSTLNQIEYACAALSNIAAIEENQRLLCKAGAIGILSAVEAEEDMGMAACTKFETDLAFIFLFCIQLLHAVFRSCTQCSAKYLEQSLEKHLQKLDFSQ